MKDWEIILIVASIWTAAGVWVWTLCKIAADADRRAEQMRRELQGEDDAEDWVGLTD